MRKPIWIVPALFLVAALGAPNAQATDIITDNTITFTGSPGTLLPTAGSFQYDVTTPSFLDFLVVWNGTTFDLTSSANSPKGLLPLPDCLSAPGPHSGAELSYILLSTCSLIDPNTAWEGYASSGPFDAQTFDFFDVLPPPASGILDIGEDLPNPIPLEASATGSWSIEETAISATPEPPTFLLFGVGLCILFLRRLR
jgi:hypothetical protein